MTITLKHRYLVFTGAEGRPLQKFTICLDGIVVESFLTKFGCSEGETPQEYFIDMASYQGRTVDVTLQEINGSANAEQQKGNAEEDLTNLYAFLSNRSTKPKDPALYRPLIRYTPQCGWMNDPNGCIFYNGK